MKPWDVAIIGGGILGTSIAYWLSTRYDSRIAVIEQEADVAEHASSRNTGVVHRPFYLHPERSRLFARSSLISYDLWETYAKVKGLPWKVVGTLKVATREEDVARLDIYMRWAERNGMDEKELDFLDSTAVRSIEPHVACEGALHAKKETAVDFGAFTRELRGDAEANGVRVLLRRRVLGMTSTKGGVEIDIDGARQPHLARYVINCAGGDAMDLAHSLGVALEYTDLHFRGEYWKVGASYSHLSGSNIYSVPRNAEFPFLDPHWIVQVSGEMEIGPNAVLVASPWIYGGFYENLLSLLQKVLEPPWVIRPVCW